MPENFGTNPGAGPAANPDSDFERPNRLDSLEQKLYSPSADFQARARKPLRERQHEIPRDWGQAAQHDLQETSLAVDTSRKNWFVRFFILALIFFLGALGYVGWKLFLGNSVDAQNVDILVNAPLTIGAGEEFAFDVLVKNENAMNMETVDIELELPEGTRSVQDIGQEFERTREQMGSIAVGQIAKKNYSALLFGEEGDKKEITVRLSYRVEGSGTIFEKEKKFEVVLQSTPVRLTVTNVRELTSGQTMTFNVEIVSNSTQTLQNVIVQATYPFGFMMQKSSLPAKEDKRTWVIPRLEPKEVVNFTVEGVLEGQNNEERYFGFKVGLEDQATGQPQVVFTSAGTTVGLARPFLELALSIDREDGEIIAVDPDVLHETEISFKNNTEFPLRNVALELFLEGAALNKNSVQVPEGFYQSTTNTIRWDTTTTRGFSSIPVGSSGLVSFNFSPLGIYTSYLAVNPELKFTARVEGNRNPESEVPQQIENSIVKTIRVNTQATIDAWSEYYSNAFANTGPVPPKAEQKTTYTAVIEIANTSNKVANGMVTMQLPNYVTYEGGFAPNTENFTYDSTTRRLTWNLGTINEKTGYEGNAARRISFQVSIVPSVSQIGSTPNLVYDLRFVGSDTFTGVDINKTGPSISTATEDAKGFYDSQVSR